MTMPSKPGVRVDEQDGAPPVANDACPKDDQRTLVRPEPCALVGSRGDDHLLAQERVLGDERATRSECVRGEAGEHRRGPHRRPNRRVRAHAPSPDVGDDASDSASERDQHARDCVDRGGQFKSWSARVPVLPSRSESSGWT